MKLEDLKKPFPENEIEWRLSQCGKKGNGQIWAMCLAYVSARSIMNRLDEVCGQDGWSVKYTHTTNGVLCDLSIWVGDEWLTKQDGAEETDIEAFKGGISSALKRAGSVWGIGRYLYGLESGFATILKEGEKGGMRGKTKEGDNFYWIPPALPSWALPEGHQSNHVPHVYPEQPKENDGGKKPEGDYVIRAGKYAQQTPEQVIKKDPEGLRSEILSVLEKYKGREMPKRAAEFVDKCSPHVATWENTTRG